MLSRIYLSAPHMGGDELGLVEEAFRTNWLSSIGPHINAFEEEFQARVGAPSCALASGTAAVHLGLRLLGVGQGDDVLVSTLTFVASVNPIVYLGARPCFIDSERTSWNLDPNVLEDALRKRAARGQKTRAMVVVHLYGQSADMDPILALSERYGVPILEDAAEALGTLYKGRQVGAFAPIGMFSFNGNKIITTTSGGMLVAKDPAHVEKARFWSTQARDPSPAYEHSELGYNYRMSNVLAGIGRGQLRVLDERVRRRREIAAFYRESFADLDGLEPMPTASWGTPTQWLSCFTVDAARLGCSRDELLAALAAEDIEARPVWKPMHIQALYRDAEAWGGAVAEDLFERGICLPSSSFLETADLMRVVTVIRQLARAGAAA
ncbi:MAG: DegT/DnrJ/EryC1/StrS family aminotransferase [Myxococcota bacterium]|nr:DegT/DnrJ/EryC1/StrS family aminotransferase [Myxococcota bacterium]